MIEEKPYIQGDILKNLIIRLVELRTPEEVAQLLAETVAPDVLLAALELTQDDRIGEDDDQMWADIYDFD